MPSDILQRRRQGIAKMVEAHRWYRGGLFAGGAAKISEAKLAGPFQYTAKKWFSSETTTRTLYCAVVKLALPLNPGHTALIEVLHSKEGGERMLMTIQRSYAPFECIKADYKPFRKSCNFARSAAVRWDMRTEAENCRPALEQAFEQAGHVTMQGNGNNQPIRFCERNRSCFVD